MAAVIGGQVDALTGGALEAPVRASLLGRRTTIRRGLSPDWPLAFLLLGYPIWWVLGLANFCLPILAIPMLIHLARRRPVRLPRGFALWVMFLLWVLFSAVAIGWHAPGTLESTGSKIFGYTFRLFNYLAGTIVLLYVGNLTERELPRGRLVKMLGVFFLYTVAGGWLGMIDKRFSFTSPVLIFMEKFPIVPSKFRSNTYLQYLLRPASSQVQQIIGAADARPKAPFDYTNTWGAMLFMLGVFFLVRFWAWGTKRQRILAVVALIFAAVPAVYSLNRGLWLACAIGIVYVAFRLAVRGRTRAVRGILAALALAALLFVATPLGTVFSKRLHHQKSNDIRTSLTVAAIKGALTSPIIGYGTDRQLQGATQSIAIGKSASCTQCGNFGIGSNGQLWLMLFAQGFPGAAFYMLFFLVVFFRSWRDYSAIGTACTLILLVSFLFDSAYSGDGATLAIYMIAAGLLWRNRQAAREGLAGSVVRPAEIPA